MTSNRYLAIINPVAKSGAAARAEHAIQHQLGDLDVTYARTECPGHAALLAGQARNFDVVIAIGGDGTVHEVVEGLMQLDEPSRPAVAIIPYGSGNDTCRMIGLPIDPTTAIGRIKTNQQRTFDLGICNGSYFVNSFSVGIDAQTVVKTIEIKEATGRSGMLLYGQALLGIILREMRPTLIEVTVEGETTRKETLLNAVTNGQTYGSGFRMNPTALPDDGTLTLSHIAWMPRHRVFVCIPRLLRATHPALNEYETREITHCRIASVDGQPLIAQMDGEVMRDATFDIKVDPQAIRFIV